jgi:hypothetical protein
MAEAVTMRRPPIVEDDEPEAVIAEPATTRFTPLVRPVEAESEEEPVPGYPAESREDQDQESVSAFAPSHPDLHSAIEPEDPIGSHGLGERTDFPAAPPTAAMESPEDAARPAGVSDLEKEMARLLDEISTTRRE